MEQARGNDSLYKIRLRSPVLSFCALGHAKIGGAQGITAIGRKYVADIKPLVDAAGLLSKLPSRPSHSA